MNGLCATLLFAHVLEVGTTTLKTHLNALQQSGVHPLRGVCWHFTHALLVTETHLLQTTRLVAVNSGLISPHSPELNPLNYWFWGACKHSVYRNKPGGLDEPCLSVEQYVYEVSADTAERMGVP